MQLKKESDTSISYQLITDNGQFRNKGFYFFKEKVEETTVTWNDSLDVSTSFFARWSARDEAFSRRIQQKNQQDLEALVNRVQAANLELEKKQ